MKRSETICARCKVNPRDPYSKNCTPCREEVKAEHQQNHIIRQRQTRAARKQHIPCICGCGKSTVYPTRYATEECRAIGKAAALAHNAAQKREARSKKLVEPLHRPLTEKELAEKEAEQERLNAEASARDRERHRQYCAAMGLVCVPDRPLASPVRMLPPEEVKRLEAVYRPPEKVEGGVHLPLRADISYY